MSSTGFTLTPLDPQILKQQLPDDIHATVDQVAANVNQSLTKIIDDFKAEAEKRAEAFRTQILPDHLQAEIDALATDFAQSISADLDGPLAAVKKALAQAEADARAAGAAAPTLLQSVQTLQGNVAQLEGKLNDLRTKVRTAGDKTSRAAVSTALKLFTGVL